MPFREHIMPPISKRRVVKAAKKPGPKPTGVAAVMGQIGKNLTPSERAVLRAPVPPPWYLEHVVDPAWVKEHAGLVRDVTKAPEAPTTIIGNHTVAYLEEILNEKLFELEPGHKPDHHHLYKLDGENHAELRKNLRDFMQRVVEEAGLVLPEDQDERDLSLDKIEAKLAPDLKGLLKSMCTTAVRHLGDNEDQLNIGELCRSVWQTCIVDGAYDCDVDPLECFDFAVESIGSQQIISYLFEGMLPFDAQRAFADLKRKGVIR